MTEQQLLPVLKKVRSRASEMRASATFADNVVTLTKHAAAALGELSTVKVNLYEPGTNEHEWARRGKLDAAREDLIRLAAYAAMLAASLDDCVPSRLEAPRE